MWATWLGDEVIWQTSSGYYCAFVYATYSYRKRDISIFENIIINKWGFMKIIYEGHIYILYISMIHQNFLLDYLNYQSYSLNSFSSSILTPSSQIPTFSNCSPLQNHHPLQYFSKFTDYTFNNIYNIKEPLSIPIQPLPTQILLLIDQLISYITPLSRQIISLQ